MHSPWGMEFSIIKETGWTRHYLLWRETWLNIQMMIADAPSFKSKTKNTGDGDDGDIIREPETIEELQRLLQNV